MEIIETDRIIAEFMEAKLIPYGEHTFVNFPDDATPPNPLHRVFLLSELKYSTSFDWLIPVALKIAKLKGYENSQPWLSLLELPLIMPINVVYNTVITFLQWKNINSPVLK